MRDSRMVRAGLASILTGLLGLHVGCSGGDPVIEADPTTPLRVTLSASSFSITEGQEVELIVSIINQTGEEQIWGQGSSICRLSATVLVDGEHLPCGPPVPCTMDMVQYRLAPHESDTQTWRWDGSVVRMGRIEQLRPGIYEVYGLGGALRSEKVVVTLTAG